mmetsp:Transcript_10299/g.35024  ORF Transcript_10299/g.35024 Transcript_10299/m.35024 type:complete len:330 (+) Transcript_10299:212-1201(+)
MRPSRIDTTATEPSHLASRALLVIVVAGRAVLLEPCEQGGRRGRAVSDRAAGCPWGSAGAGLWHGGDGLRRARALWPGRSCDAPRCPARPCSTGPSPRSSHARPGPSPHSHERSSGCGRGYWAGATRGRPWSRAPAVALLHGVVFKAALGTPKGLAHQRLVLAMQPFSRRPRLLIRQGTRTREHALRVCAVVAAAHGAELVQVVHDVHFKLGRSRPVPEARRGVGSVRRGGALITRLLRAGGGAPGLVGARRARLHLVVLVLGVRLKSVLGSAVGALLEEPDLPDADVVLPCGVLSARIALAPAREELAARAASDGHGQHHAHRQGPGL